MYYFTLILMVKSRPNIFTNMISVLRPPTPNSTWPMSLALPKLTNVSSDAPKVQIADQLVELVKPTQRIIVCPHKNRKIYAKNMCNSCYHKKGRASYAWACEHKNEKMYAKGKCHRCYIRSYTRKARSCFIA